jgi:hypothetical protein
MQQKHPEQRGMGGQVEIRNNIKILISNDQNISGTYTKFTGYWHVLNFGFMSFVFVFPPRRDISSFGFPGN